MDGLVPKESESQVVADVGVGQKDTVDWVTVDPVIRRLTKIPQGR